MLILLNVFLLSSCLKLYSFNDKIETNSDGSYVIETGMSDEELLSYGQVVVYRFKSVPNMVAVKTLNIGKPSHNYIYNSNIYNLPAKNSKNRFDAPNFPNVSDFFSNCSNAYCEAKFDKVIEKIQDKNLSLNPVKIAIVDSGVVPATVQIQKNLVSSLNMTGDQNLDDWSTHATYIASVFSGIIKNNNVTNIYAQNAKLYSIKIAFAGDLEDSNQKKYGSMQLAAALDEAVYSGAKVVNLSLSYTQEPDQNVEMAEKIVISNASKKGVLFIVAAGNDGNNLNHIPTFPASYNLNNIITIGSHRADLSKADSSNYGSAVDLSAQGAFIELNNKNGGIDRVGGTSFSVPIVASALSLYYGLFPNADMDITLKHLFFSANSSYNTINTIHDNKISKYGRLDTKAFIDLGMSFYYKNSN